MGRQASGPVCPLGPTGQSTLVDLDGSGRWEGTGGCSAAGGPAGLLAGAAPGAVGARVLVATGEAYSGPEPLGTYLKSQKLDVSTAEGRTMTLEPSSLSSGFVTHFSPSPTWPAGQSPICAHRHCNWESSMSKTGISWRHWRGPRGGREAAGRRTARDPT